MGRLTLVDFDQVGESNLGRQVLYGPDDVGRPKVAVARERLAAQNPCVRVDVDRRRADRALLEALLDDHDLLLDATDNFAARLAANDACLAHGKPWIMGAAARTEGQLMALRPDLPDAPCYRCAYGDAGERLEDCAGGGVLGPVTGLVGSAMATMALQLLAGQDVSRRLHLLDAAGWQWRSLVVRRRPGCAACGPASG